MPVLTDDAVVKVLRDLREIEDLDVHLEVQAIHQASSRLMPGGLAMASLGPVASPEMFANLIDIAERTAIERAAAQGVDPGKFMPPVDDDPWESPLQLLRYWSETWRTMHGMVYRQKATIASEVNFLRWITAWAYDNDQRFARYADDVNAARVGLENILYAGERAERTRVMCDREHCGRRRLIRVRAARQVAAWRCRTCSHTIGLDDQADHCPNPWCWSVAPPDAVWISDPDDDSWKCTACKTRYDQRDFQAAYAKQLRSEGAQRFVPLADAIATLKAQGRGERTIRRWLAPSSNGEAVVESYCELGTHTVQVWWPDLWRLHNTSRMTPRRSRDNVGAA